MWRSSPGCLGSVVRNEGSLPGSPYAWRRPPWIATSSVAMARPDPGSRRSCVRVQCRLSKAVRHHGGRPHQVMPTPRSRTRLGFGVTRGHGDRHVCPVGVFDRVDDQVADDALDAALVDTSAAARLRASPRRRCANSAQPSTTRVTMGRRSCSSASGRALAPHRSAKFRGGRRASPLHAFSLVVQQFSGTARVGRQVIAVGYDLFGHADRGQRGAQLGKETSETEALLELSPARVAGDCVLEEVSLKARPRAGTVHARRARPGLSFRRPGGPRRQSGREEEAC